jgi:hypothetical protein
MEPKLTTDTKDTTTKTKPVVVIRSDSQPKMSASKH